MTFCRLIRKIRLIHSGNPDCVLQSAGSFLVFQNMSCNLQEAFWCSRIRPAICRKLSGVPETLLQICEEHSGNPETFFHICEDISGVPENVLRIAGSFRGLQYPATLRSELLHIYLNRFLFGSALIVNSSRPPSMIS